MNKPLLLFGGCLIVGFALLFDLTCKRQSQSIKSQGDSLRGSLGRVERSQADIAKEIVLICSAYFEALVQMDRNSKKSVVRFASKADLFSSRLEDLAKEIDTHGPFPPSLCEATRKQLDNIHDTYKRDGKKGKVAREPMPDDIARIYEKAVVRFLVAWGSVGDKAGITVAVDKEKSSEKTTKDGE